MRISIDILNDMSQCVITRYFEVNEDNTVTADMNQEIEHMIAAAHDYENNKAL